MIAVSRRQWPIRSFGCIGVIDKINFTPACDWPKLLAMTLSLSPPAHESVEVTAGVVLIRNPNTTIGYCRFTPTGDIEYIFVNPVYRRRGYGRRLLAAVAQATGCVGEPLEPISPLGRRLFGLASAA